MHILSLGVLGEFLFVFKSSSFNYPIFSVFFLLLVCFRYFYMFSIFRLIFSILGCFLFLVELVLGLIMMTMINND